MSNQSWRLQYGRMLRAYDSAKAGDPGARRTEDHYYEFFASCHHLREWLENDPAARVPNADLRALVDANRCLQLSGDITNRVKHLVRRQKPYIDEAARLSVMLPTPGAVQPEVVLLVSGQLEDVSVVADECVGVWNTFLRDKGLT